MLAGLLVGALCQGEEVNEQQRNHWAWRALQKPAVPSVSERGFVRNPIDAFILSRVEAAKGSMAPAATPATLLRRVYLDLIGIPPTPKELEAFVANPSEEAYAKVVDDLLARPQYGERWGRHWLDVVRYAETKGYERDEYKKFVWRYRDYVIDALNADIPYNRFILEQLAGDELDEVTFQSQVATTFLSLGTFDTIAADSQVARYDTLDDIVATTSMAFLGQTIQCARCHDHKFEPVSQKDYYRVLAAFESLDVTKRERQLGTPEDIKAFNERLQKHRDEQLNPKRAIEEQLWLPMLKRLQKDGPPEGKKQRLNDKQLQEAIEAVETKPADRSNKHRHWVDRERKRIRSALYEIGNEEERKSLKEQETLVAEVEATRPEPLMGWVYPDRPRPSATHMRIRGDVHQKGEAIPFGLPVVLDRGELEEPKPTQKSSGRRRALAEWIVGPGAPLAARVMANRVWQYHFGNGLVPEANNLGVKGGAPSHPQLLEWLAQELMAGDWKLKPLHRTIVLSNSYRRASTHPNLDFDQENKLFSRWPVHRLEAEAIRDSVLAITGKLNLKQHGPPVYPPRSGKQVVGASAGLDWKKSSEEESNRRSVYIFAKRSIPFPDLAVLGSPDSSCSCEKRTVSTTAVQSLLMMNGAFLNDQARLLAERLRKEAGESVEAQVKLAFELALSRKATERELQDASTFMAQAATLDPKDDALASFCLVLFNTNEFVYRN